MDIKISKSARVCRACERDFVHEEIVYSLVRVQDRELLREDFCPMCWQSARAAEAYSHWHTKYYDPRVAEQAPAEAFSPLRQLFYEAVEAEDRVEQAKAFLAAQLLRRQKVFRQIKESDEADGETKIVLFNDRIGNRLIEVRDPQFTYAELDAGRVRLMDRLMALEAAAAAPEATTETTEVPPNAEETDTPRTGADTSDDSDSSDSSDSSDDGNGDDDGDTDDDDDDDEYDDDEFDEDDDDDDDAENDDALDEESEEDLTSGN